MKFWEILEEEKSPELFGVSLFFEEPMSKHFRLFSYNMLLGIGGVVTFKNGKIDQFLDRIDLRHIVLETDSPYLAPIPFLAKRNRKQLCGECGSKVGNNLQQVYPITQITTENSKRIIWDLRRKVP